MDKEIEKLKEKKKGNRCTRTDGYLQTPKIFTYVFFLRLSSPPSSTCLTLLGHIASLLILAHQVQLK